RSMRPIGSVAVGEPPAPDVVDGPGGVEAGGATGGADGGGGGGARQPGRGTAAANRTAATMRAGRMATFSLQMLDPVGPDPQRGGGRSRHGYRRASPHHSTAH